ncbi:MAG: rod shape-determining protein MreC [Caldilineaceae bacterium]|nr:rod shape-determining protein MreC [Caldilineaceae bacterium]
MRNSERRFRSAGDIGIRLVILALAAVILMALQVTGRLATLQSALTQFTSPAQLGATGATNVVVDWVNFFAELGRLRVRNAELEELNQTLVSENFRLSEVERENQALRELLDFAVTQPSLEMRGAQIVARVLGQDSINFQNFILLDLGSEQGIEEGMPVVTNLGLVGRITEVNPTTSKVLLITDPNSGVNAILSNSRVNGVIKGVPGSTLIMDYIPQDVVISVGEDILTSGLTSEIGGGRFPKGIPIGQVVQIIQSDEEVSQQAIVIPAVDFAKLDLVLVITNYKPGEGLPEILLPNGFGVDTSASDGAASDGIDAAPTATPAEQN